MDYVQNTIHDSLRCEGLTRLVVFDKLEHVEKNFYITKMSKGYFVSTGYVGKPIYDIRKFIRNLYKSHPEDRFRIYTTNTTNTNI